MTSKTSKTKPDSTRPEVEGITMEELLELKTVPVIKKAVAPVRISGQEDRRPAIVGIIQDGDYEGKEHKWGLITQNVVEKVLSSATRSNGDLIVHLPEPKEDDLAKGISWVNYL
jgi:hypothetical protein